MKPSTGSPTRSVQHSPAAPGLRAHPVHPAESPGPDTVWQNLSTTVDGISIKKTDSGVFPEISSAQVRPRTARVSPKALHSILPACCAQAASCRGAVTPAKQMLPKPFWLPLWLPSPGSENISPCLNVPSPPRMATSLCQTPALPAGLAVRAQLQSCRVLLKAVPGPVICQCGDRRRLPV